MEAEDPLESISGTDGVTGAADAVLVLNRDAKGTTTIRRPNTSNSTKDYTPHGHLNQNHFFHNFCRHSRPACRRKHRSQEPSRYGNPCTFKFGSAPTSVTDGFSLDGARLAVKVEVFCFQATKLRSTPSSHGQRWARQ